jgi:hypothetical protein
VIIDRTPSRRERPTRTAFVIIARKLPEYLGNPMFDRLNCSRRYRHKSRCGRNRRSRSLTWKTSSHAQTTASRMRPHPSTSTLRRRPRRNSPCSCRREHQRRPVRDRLETARCCARAYCRIAFDRTSKPLAGGRLTEECSIVCAWWSGSLSRIKVKYLTLKVAASHIES